MIRVLGKGGRERALPFGRKTSVTLDRYLRVRACHKHAHLDALWIGRRGALTIYGIRELIERRGKQAGIPDLYPTSSAIPLPTNASAWEETRPT